MTASILKLLPFFAVISVSLTLTSNSSYSSGYFEYYKAYKRQGQNQNRLAISTVVPMVGGLNSYDTFTSILEGDGANANLNCKDVSQTRQSPWQSICPWVYVCDYNPLRIPQAMYYAKCTQNYWYEKDSTGSLVAKHQCREATYAVPTLSLNGAASWEWRMETIKVSCIAIQ